MRIATKPMWAQRTQMPSPCPTPLYAANNRIFIFLLTM
jgi:hypothetical protein